MEFPEFRNSFFFRGGIMNYWLMKSEPGVFGVDDLARAPGKTAAWWGVRNYQARNFMRDQMIVGDRVFFFHSSCPEPGIAGLQGFRSWLIRTKPSSIAERILSIPKRRATTRAGSTST